MNESLLEIKFTGLAGFKQIRHCVMEYVKARLQGQPSLMEVALNEAVNNAIKHGHAKVKLRLNVIAGKRLVVRVKDQGGRLCRERAINPHDDSRGQLARKW